MTIRKRIIDYSDHNDEIEKWLRVKGDEKYSQFADILDNNGIEITWAKVSDLYRYDKRLLNNNFRYISFFEEYLRAILMNNSVDISNDYESLQEEYFKGLIEKVLALDINIQKEYFEEIDMLSRMRMLRELRNWIAHNKIILQLEYPQHLMKTFCSVLPLDYREGYRKDINKCVCGLDVDNNIAIMI